VTQFDGATYVIFQCASIVTVTIVVNPLFDMKFS